MTQTCPSLSTSTSSSTRALLSFSTLPRSWGQKLTTNFSTSFCHAIWEEGPCLIITIGSHSESEWRLLRKWYPLKARPCSGPGVVDIDASWGTCSMSLNEGRKGMVTGWRLIYGMRRGSRWSNDGVSSTRRDARTNLTGALTSLRSMSQLSLWTRATTHISSCNSRQQKS